jgi:hypothetical protein
MAVSLQLPQHQTSKAMLQYLRRSTVILLQNGWHQRSTTLVLLPLLDCSLHLYHRRSTAMLMLPL